MSSKHAKLLNEIFKDPVSGNLHWRDIESLLHHLGAQVEPHSGARLHVFLNNVEGVLHRPHHSGVCTKQEIRHIRDYLASARITPALYDAGL